MPMTYDDDALLSCANWRFREKRDDESMEEFRAAFADQTEQQDPVDGHEIRTGVSWRDWSEEQFIEFLNRGDNAKYAIRNPGMLSLMVKYNVLPGS